MNKKQPANNVTVPTPALTLALLTEFLLRLTEQPCEVGPIPYTKKGKVIEASTCLDAPKKEFKKTRMDTPCWPCQARVVAAQIDAFESRRCCRVCGCTEDRACCSPGGEPCHWVEWDLCSACAGKVAQVSQPAGAEAAIPAVASVPSVPQNSVDLTPIPELKGTFPLVLYFGNTTDRDEFIEVFKQAKPGLKTIPL